ncbi:DNA polymerase [Mycobacterium sp.]|uniref:DNA polymerase n=1 Tax=Mycobacterium sp. TaxID=1785 RepID=UPI002579E524|nr:DNA polymerase [Mycobacterium sp.]
MVLSLWVQWRDYLLVPRGAGRRIMAKDEDVSNGFDVRGRLLRDGELAPWLAENSLGNRFGLAVVGSDEGHRSKAVALAIVAADGDGRYLDIATLTDDDEAALASWLADPGPPKAVHEGKSTLHALANCGWTLRGVTSDTALAAHVVRPGRRSPALNELLIDHMRCALHDEALELKLFSSPPGERAVRALILRACAVLDLADVLDEELARIDSSSLLWRVELPAQRVLAGLEIAGIAVHPGVPDGRIHPTYRQATSPTGAVSSSQPNLRGLRARFVAGEGYGGLLTARYDALETRLLAHLSGDTGLVDPHPAESSRSVLRALAYGWTADELAAMLKTSPGDAKHLVLQYLSETLLDQLTGAIAAARELGYAATLSGRRRYLRDLNSSDPAARRAAERAVCVMALQGGVADIVKTAMITTNEAITAAGLASRMVAQIDDRLVFEVAAGERDAVAEYVRDQMAGAYQLDAPLAVSVAD